MAKIFIAHASEDKHFALDLQGRLNAKEHDAWLDTQMYAGDELHQTIAEQIAHRDVILFVLSPDAIRSDWVHKELSLAQLPDGSGRKKLLLPLLLRACSEIPPALKGIKYADFRDGRQQGWEELEQALSRTSTHGSRGQGVPTGNRQTPRRRRFIVAACVVGMMGGLLFIWHQEPWRHPPPQEVEQKPREETTGESASRSTTTSETAQLNPSSPPTGDAHKPTSVEQRTSSSRLAEKPSSAVAGTSTAEKMTRLLQTLKQGPPYHPEKPIWRENIQGKRIDVYFTAGRVEDAARMVHILRSLGGQVDHHLISRRKAPSQDGVLYHSGSSMKTVDSIRYALWEIQELSDYSHGNGDTELEIWIK